MQKSQRKKILAVLTVFFSLTSAITAFAVPAELWPTTGSPVEILLTDKPGGGTPNQQYPQVIRASDGDYIAAWHDDDGTYRDLFVQKIDASDGSASWNSGNAVVITSADSAYQPEANYDITSDGAGGIFLVWERCPNASCASRSVRAQHMNSSGAKQWGANGVEVAASGNDPVLLADGSGGLYVAYHHTTSGNNVGVIRLNSSGTVHGSWVPASAVDVPGDNTETEPEIIAAGSSIIVAYLKSNEIYAAKYDNAGSPAAAPWGSGVKVSSTSGTVNSFSLVTDGSSGLIAAYDNNLASVKTQRVNAAGATQWGSGLNVKTATVNLVRAIEDGTGGVFVAWNQTSDVYAQHITNNGAVDPDWTAGGEAASNTGNGQNDQMTSATGHTNLASDGQSGIIIAFDALGTTDVRLQRIDMDGTVLWGSNGYGFGTTTDGSDDSAYLAGNNNQGAAIVWRGETNNDDLYDIYIQSVSDLSQCGALLDNDEDSNPPNVISEGCLELEVTAGTLSFENVPSSFSFPNRFKSGQVQHSFSNDNPATAAVDVTTESTDILTVTDLRNSGGFDVTITSSAVTDSENTLPLINLYIATTYPEDNDLIPLNANLVGTEANEIEFGSGTVNTGNIDTALTVHSANATGTNALTLINAYTTDGKSFDANNDTTPDTIYLMRSTAARISQMSQALGFYLRIPADQEAGNYSFLLTLDLIAS